MKVTKLTLVRTGDVFWHVRGQYHCGIEEGWLRYTVELVCTPKTDDHGFLIDQLAIDDFISSYARQRHLESCELAAIALAKALHRKLRKQAKHCEVLTLKLTLSPQPYKAAMAVEME